MSESDSETLEVPLPAVTERTVLEGLCHWVTARTIGWLQPAPAADESEVGARRKLLALVQIYLDRRERAVERRVMARVRAEFARRGM